MTLSASRALWPAPFVDQRGNRRAGLTITVYELGTGPAPDGDGSLVLAQLFVDDALTTLGPNPVTTDAGGNETSIKAAAGYYDAVVDGETIRMLVLDPASAVQARGGGGEVVATIANAGSAATLNLADANVFVVENPTAGGTCVLTLAGATAGRSCGGTIYFHQRASGDSALAFAGGTVLHMNDGDLPGPAQVADAVSVYGWATLDGGATIYVWKVGDSGTVAPPAAPDAPTGVVGTRGNAQVSVAFTPGASNGAAITSYTVTASPGGATATGASSPIVVTGLGNGTPYTFTVHATNSEGDSPESSPSAAVTPATVPGAPTAVVGTPGNTSASIAFAAPGSNGGAAISGYTATLSPGGATFTGTTSPISATGLTNGTAYTATIHATNSEGNSTESTASSPFTPAAGPTFPDAPTIGTATAGNAKATVTHTPNGNGGSAITGCTITPYIAGVAQTAQTFMDTATTHDVVGLTNGTAYTFKVALINVVGTGARSGATNSVTPSAPGASDNFNRPDGALGTSSSGRVWSESYAYGQLLVVGNKAGESTVTGGSASLETGLTDYTETIDFTVSGSNPTEHHFNFRQIDGANYLSFQLYRYDPSGGGTTAQVLKRVAGTWTGISGGAFPTIAGGSHTAQIVVSGDSIICKVDGSTIFSITLDSGDHATFSAATKAGIGSGRSSALNDGTFDNFDVSP